MLSISFIIPVFNPPADAFKRSLNSILCQDGDIELVIIDDGSEAYIREILAQINDRRIIYFRQENAGPSAARNNGILKASKEYITFVDSDDTIEKDFCKYLCSRIKPEDDFTIIGANHVFPKKTVSSVPVYRELETDDRFKLTDAVIGKISGRSEFSSIEGLDATWGKIYKSSFLKEFSILFDTDLRRYEDSFFFLSAVRVFSSATILDYVGYNYYHNPDSICHKYDPTVFDDIHKAYIRCKAYLEENYPDNTDNQMILSYRVAEIICNDSVSRYFCNKDNPKTKKERKKEFISFLNTNNEYKEAYMNLSKAKFPLNIYSYLIRHNKAGMLFSIYSAINGVLSLYFSIRN